MRQSAFVLFLLLTLFLAGCGINQNAGQGAVQSADPDISPSAGLYNDCFSESPAYHSNISTEDCFLCGSTENRVLSQWGQNNIALISLSTFEMKPIEINCYDGKQLIEEFAGFSLITGFAGKDGGFTASLMQDYDRGYASGFVWFHDDAVLDTGKMAGFLCEDCLNEILPSRPDRCFGVGAVDLATKKVRIFAEDIRGFTLEDFYIDCDLQDKDGDQPRMELLIFYCPIRYEKEP